MGKVLEFIKNREPLKIAIMDYEVGELSVIHISNKYYMDHWKVFKRAKDRNPITASEFNDRLYNYLWTQKVSELIVILYLEDIQDSHPTIFELNRLLNRANYQYSATFKSIKKLEQLDIIFTKPVKDSSRKEKKVFIKRNTVKIYGEDEFRAMMLKEWDTDAKEYIKKRVKGLREQKSAVQKRIKLIKKGKRV